MVTYDELLEQAARDKWEELCALIAEATGVDVETAEEARSAVDELVPRLWAAVEELRYMERTEGFGAVEQRAEMDDYAADLAARAVRDEEMCP